MSMPDRTSILPSVGDSKDQGMSLSIKLEAPSLSVEDPGAQEALIEAQKKLSADAEALVNTINAPRAPKSPNSRHVSSRLEVQVEAKAKADGPQDSPLPEPLSLEKEEEGVEEVEIDEEEQEVAAKQQEGGVRKDSMYHFYGTPEVDNKKRDEGQGRGASPMMDLSGKMSNLSSIKVPGQLSTASMKEGGQKVAGMQTGEIAVEKGKELYDSFSKQDKGGNNDDAGARKQSGPNIEGKLLKKASFTDDRVSFSGGKRRRVPTPSGNRPVSREDVANMIIPPFSPDIGRSGSGASDQARVSRPISRELLMSGSGLRTPGMGMRPPSSSIADAVVEQPGEREGDDSSVSSLRDGESVDSTGLQQQPGGGEGVGQGDGDKDGDDSTVSSLNSTDQALIGDLRRGLGDAVNSSVEEVSKRGKQAVDTDKEYFDSLFNQGAHSAENGGGNGDVNFALDGQLGEGVVHVPMGGSDEDQEVSAVQMPLDLSQFDFATGSYVTDGSNPQKGGMTGLVVSPTHEHEFTDAMAVRPRTNERPSSTQQKYLDMYARAQTPIPLDNLEGLELEIGPEPQSARSVNSQLTMSTLDTMSVRSGAAPPRREEEKAARTSTIPFPFQQPPVLPHVDKGIRDEKLRYESIKKPFLTQSDEAHNKIRAKMLRRQERRRAKVAALMEVERLRRERQELLLADFTREQVSAAMDYFRTMCAQLSKEASQRARGANNQADDGTVSTANTHSSVDSGTSTMNRTSGKNRSKQQQQQRKKKKKNNNNNKNKGGADGRSGAAVYKSQGRFAPAQDDEMRLDELEAVLRKYRRAKVTLEDEEHGRGLLLSLEWLLEELDMSPMQWFDMVDSRGGTKTGDRKLTYLELSRGVDMLCDELSRKMTRRLKMEAKEAQERARAKRREAIMHEAGGSSPDSPALSAGGSGTDSRSLRSSRGASSPSPLLQIDTGAANAEEAQMALPPESPSRVRDVEVPHWRRQDLHALLKYLDPNGDGDISVCEMKLAFKNLHLSLESQRVVDGAGPIIRRMVEYMKEKQLTVKDLFALIDTDRSMTISTDELFRAMNTFFKKPPTEDEEEARLEKMMALAALDLDSSGSLDSGDELSLGGTLGASVGQSTTDPVSVSMGTRGWADFSVSGASKAGSAVSSRFGPTVNTDMSSSWQPRGNLNSRGKHVFLRKSASSVVLRPVKTRKSSQNQGQGQGQGRKAGAGGSRDARESATGTANSRGSPSQSRGRTRNNTASSTRSGATASGSRTNSSEGASKSMLKGIRRSGTFVGGALPGMGGSGLPGLGVGPGGKAAGANAHGLGSGNVANALSLLAAKGSSNSKVNRLAKAKLLPTHKKILNSYGDLFDRQYDELSISLPAKNEEGAGR